jgi:hypothetical protein
MCKLHINPAVRSNRTLIRQKNYYTTLMKARTSGTPYAVAEFENKCRGATGQARITAASGVEATRRDWAKRALERRGGGQEDRD